MRVYPGKNCHGTAYLDDGHSFAYKRGEFLRLEFSCSALRNGLMLHIGERQGTFRPWWNKVQVEVYGWNSSVAHVSLKGKASDLTATIDGTRHAVTVELPDDSRGSDLEILNSN